MDLGLDRRGAVVVGAAGGIGRAVCHALVAEGVARLTLAVRSPDAGRELADELAELGDTALSVSECDLLEPDHPEACVADAEARGSVDVLVMCAGAPPGGSLWDVDDETWHRALEDKLLGSARLIRAAAPRMADRGWGRIVVVAGMGGRTPKAGGVVGGVVNAGLASLVGSAAKKMAASGVTVNAVDPAHVRTPRWDRRIEARMAEEGISEEEAIAQILSASPSEEMVAPQDVADLIAYLASERAAKVTGTPVLVDGGEFPGLY